MPRRPNLAAQFDRELKAEYQHHRQRLQEQRRRDATVRREKFTAMVSSAQAAAEDANRRLLALVLGQISR